MNLWKVTAGLSLLLFAIVVACGHPAVAPSAAACNNQPNMEHALNDLRAARTYLERAEHNKGGWREKALESTVACIRETERGCAYADNL
jgi:hypothetical protein